MFDNDAEIDSGMTVVHNEGLRYHVEDARRSTNVYEALHRLGGMVLNYTQLEPGIFPSGTKWAKAEEEFRLFFTPVSKS